MPRRIPVGMTVPCWILAAILSGCGGTSEMPSNGPEEAPTQDTEPLRIAAASDLQAALPDLTEAFEVKRGVRVEFVLGSSGQLSMQIRQGAPFDVFLAANRSYVEELAESGDVLPESVQSYAEGRLVLAVNRKSGIVLKGLDDLKKPDVRKIALANPEVAPYGRAARQALESAGLWEPLEPKRVQAESVRQALQFVETGNAEAGLVGHAIADASNKVDLVPIDPKLYEPLVQALGVVSESRRNDDARAFCEFLLGSEGKSILLRHHFAAPPGGDSSEPSLSNH